MAPSDYKHENELVTFDTWNMRERGGQGGSGGGGGERERK